MSQAVSRSVHTTVQVAVEDSPATAAAASIRIDAFLRGDAEQREDVRLLGLVVRLPVAHLGVLHDAGAVAVGKVVGHGGLLGGVWGAL
jgi:hypothetical protein